MVNILLIINMTTISLLFLVLIYYGNLISKTIGFKELSYYYKAFKGRSKGLILIRVYNEDSSVNYFIGHKKASKLILSNINGDEQQSAFILNPQCIYKNELGLNCIDYFESDIDPRDWKSGQEVTTSPIALQNIVTNATKAEVMSNGMQDFFLKHFKTIGLGVIILVGILGFIILTQNGDITTCYQQMSSINVVAQ